MYILQIMCVHFLCLSGPKLGLCSEAIPDRAEESLVAAWSFGTQGILCVAWKLNCPLIIQNQESNMLPDAMTPPDRLYAPLTLSCDLTLFLPFSQMA